MELSALARTLGQRLDLRDLDAGPDDRFQLVVDGDITVDVEALRDGAGLVMLAQISAVAGEERAALLARLLATNLLDRHGDGSFIALDEAYGRIVLCRRMEGEVDYPAFEAGLEALVNRAERLRTQLQQEGAAQTPAEGEAWGDFTLRV